MPAKGKVDNKDSAKFRARFGEPEGPPLEPVDYHVRVIDVSARRGDTLQCGAKGDKVPGQCESVGTNGIQCIAWDIANSILALI